MDNQKMRLGLYRKIEIARKQLPAMDEEAFRALLRSEFGVSSRKDMSVNQLSRLVQHFAAVHGVTYTAPAKSRNPRVTPHGRPDFIEITDSMPYAREKRQILAIWRRLGSVSYTHLDVYKRQGLYRDLGCSVIHAWPYHGQSKPIERFFGTFHDMEVWMPSYTGNDIAHKPARMKRGEDLHRQLYDKLGGRPLTLEETHAQVARWFVDYANRPQYRTHLHGRTPGEVFMEGRGAALSSQDMQKLALFMMQKDCLLYTSRCV